MEPVGWALPTSGVLGSLPIAISIENRSHMKVKLQSLLVLFSSEILTIHYSLFTIHYPLSPTPYPLNSYNSIAALTPR